MPDTSALKSRRIVPNRIFLVSRLRDSLRKSLDLLEY